MIKNSAILLLALLFFSTRANAQENIVISDTLSGWDYGWVTNINGSQASYSNWSQGGVNNIAATGGSAARAYYREDKFAYGFLINARYGQTKIEDEGTRKTDDQLLIKNRVTYDIGNDANNLSLYGSLDFRTQFDKGFNYGAGPDGEDILISNFLAPGYFSQNVGLAYTPTDQFSFESGLGMRQTIVRDIDLSTLYGLDESDTIRNEVGLNLGAVYQQSIANNLRLNSSLETFTSVNSALSSTDIYFSNEIAARINNFMNTSLRFDLVYDDDFSNEVQVRQSLTLGVSFILI